MNADNVVQTIRKTHAVIRESNEFLQKLYNAEENALWYKPMGTEEIYTTIDPDYRRILKSKYKQKMAEIRQVQGEIDKESERNAEITKALQAKSSIKEREPLLKQKAQSNAVLAKLGRKRDELVDEGLTIDVDLIQAAYDEHDKTVSVKKKDVAFNVFQQVWNEKIMNSYEKDKLQYLTSEEKTRYFKEKARELKKVDKYGVLNHPDWFFRVVVLDFIVAEMKDLIYWFKNCAYGDFDTIYRIVRKLNLLHLDVDAIRSEKKFNINRTNLFYISDEDAMDFTKIDQMLTGNTFYDLFQREISIDFLPYEEDDVEVAATEQTKEEKEIVQERDQDVLVDQQRRVRQDVVRRFWGNEENLTRAAYEVVSKDDCRLDGQGPDGIETMGQLKREIIKLKLSDPQSQTLSDLLMSFTNIVTGVKEAMVMDKMNEMNKDAGEEVGKMDDSANANTSSDVN